MSIPETPPKFDLRKYPQDVTTSRILFKSGFDPRLKGRYLHWDKLKRIPAPEGITHEQWWMAIQLGRQMGSKNIPLIATDRSHFSYNLPDPIMESLHKIDTGIGGFVTTGRGVINTSMRDEYHVRSLMEEAITSSQLEGAATTRRVAQDMIRTSRTPRDRSERMILNNYRTMRRITELRKSPLTVELLFEIQQLMTEDTLDNPADSGRFRLVNDPIVVVDNQQRTIFEPPPASELPQRVDAMCRFANEETPDYFIHPVIRAIILHFWLAYDHPFADGNGRTARALFYWSMQRSEFGLSEFISISSILKKAPAKYYESFLYTETDGNDLTYFLLHQLEVILRAIDELRSYIERKTAQAAELQVRLTGFAHFNHRQRDLLGHALRHPHQIYTIEGHRISHNVVHQTARTDIWELHEKGLLTARKVGKTWNFMPVENLERLLAEAD